MALLSNNLQKYTYLDFLSRAISRLISSPKARGNSERSNLSVTESNYTAKISGPFFKCEVYNCKGDVISSTWLDKPPHFDNYTEKDCALFLEAKEMAKINRNITLNGKRHCIRANTEQEYADKLASLITASSDGIPATPSGKHNFADYAWNWFDVYSKPNIATVTASTYKRQIERYLIPSFGLDWILAQ